jgi:hypothetical protein
MTQNYVVFVFLDFAKNDEILDFLNFAVVPPDSGDLRSLIVGGGKLHSFRRTFSSEPTNQHTLDVPDHKNIIKLYL